jgi:hypothetical protein
MKNANYRKYNDRSHNSSTYHKKDGTPVRNKLKQETEQEKKNPKILKPRVDKHKSACTTETYKTILLKGNSYEKRKL